MVGGVVGRRSGGHGGQRGGQGVASPMLWGAEIVFVLEVLGKTGKVRHTDRQVVYI